MALVVHMELMIDGVVFEIGDESSHVDDGQGNRLLG